MVAYIWLCHACGGSNPAGSDKCAACGCDAVASRAGLERDLVTLKARNAAVDLAPMATGLQLLFGLGATIALIVGGLLVFFSEETPTGFVVAFGGYLLAKLAGRLGKPNPADVPSDAQI